MSNPHVRDSSQWEAALEHYHWDRMEAAYAAIQGHGIGEAGGHLRWYRVIEAEHITRHKSTMVEVNRWLSVEFVASELMDLRESLIQRVLEACEEVARRLDWHHSEKTLVSILAEETDAPWATHPYGYCVHKEPYEKICLPNYLVDDPEEFTQAVAHEYAHVISEALGDGYSPRWLDEALSVLVEQRFEEETWRGFRDGTLPWLPAAELELVLEGRANDDSNKDAVWNAYQQAGWIGRYLASLGQEEGLAKLLRKVADEGMVWNLARLTLGRDRVEAALRATYGLGVRQLFDQSLEYLRSVSSPN